MLIKDIKMGYNSWVNWAHHGFGPSWVENFFQISVRVNFWPGPPRIRLTNQQTKGHTTVLYYVGFCIWIGLGCL